MPSKRILIIDNQDSFVYNLVQLVREAKEPCFFDVLRSDCLQPSLVNHYDALIISPGPGLPEDQEKMMELLRLFKGAGKAILGICLGCQAIALMEGYSLRQLKHPLHGHTSYLIAQEDPIMEGIDRGSAIARYHSWVVDLDSCTSGKPSLIELGYSEDIDGRQTMALRHKDLPIWGLQFHPESMISENGQRYIDNWLRQI